MSETHYNLDTIRDSEIRRLADEHLKLETLAEANLEMVAITPTERSKVSPHPPIEYEVQYKVKSMVGVDEAEQPLYGELHTMRIQLPKGYPLQPAECKMVTDTWHPNIKSDGPFKGSICTNHGGFGTLFYLDELVVRIGEFLQYKRYLAEDIPPWPEDQKVARWVRKIAEPQEIVDRKKGKAIDTRPWRYLPPGIETNEDEIFFFEKESDSSPMGGNADDDSEISILDI
ncbi:MAG: ubiquitin-conjugating enzyme E2 [Bacteroidota bacterium]